MLIWPPYRLVSDDAQRPEEVANVIMNIVRLYVCLYVPPYSPVSYILGVGVYC